MVDAAEHEVAAIQHAYQMGGEFLAELGTADLEQLTEDQGLEFCNVVITGYMSYLDTLPPF